MGTEIKRNAKGLYQLRSTISDELKHKDRWVSEDDAKKSLIKDVLWRMIEDVVKIELDFPEDYRVNGVTKVGSRKGLQFIVDSYKSTESSPIHDKFLEIIKKHNLEEYFEPEKV
jgi:hypothetical protein